MNDLISRKAAIEAVAKALKGTFVEYEDIAEKIINKVPPAQSFDKGLWVKQELAPQTLRFCSLCGYKKPRGLANFCPNCGADMRGEDNEND